MPLLARIQSKFPKRILARSYHGEGGAGGGSGSEDVDNEAEEVSILGLKSISRTDVHDRMEFVEDSVDVVRLTFEDLINDMDTDLLGGVYSVLTCDDRNWQYIRFTDSVKLRSFQSWNQNRHVMIHHLADAGRDYPLFFLANIEFTIQRCQRIPADCRDSLFKRLHHGTPSPWDDPNFDDVDATFQGAAASGTDAKTGGHPNASAIEFIQALRVIQREKRVTRVSFEGAVALEDPNDPSLWLQLLKIFKPPPKHKMTKKMMSFRGQPSSGGDSDDDEKNLFMAPENDVGKKYIKMSVHIPVTSFTDKDRHHHDEDDDDYYDNDDEETPTGDSDEKTDDSDIWRDHLERTVEILERMAGIDEEYFDESHGDDSHQGRSQSSGRRGGQGFIVTSSGGVINSRSHVVDDNSSNHKRKNDEHRGRIYRDADGGKSKSSSSKTRSRANSHHEESVEQGSSKSKSSRNRMRRSTSHQEGTENPRKREPSKSRRHQRSRSSGHHRHHRDEGDHNMSSSAKKRKSQGSSRAKQGSSSSANNKVSSTKHEKSVNRDEEEEVKSSSDNKIKKKVHHSSSGTRSKPSRSSSHKSSSRNHASSGHRHHASSSHHGDDVKTGDDDDDDGQSYVKHLVGVERSSSSGGPRRTGKKKDKQGRSEEEDDERSTKHRSSRKKKESSSNSYTSQEATSKKAPTKRRETKTVKRNRTAPSSTTTTSISNASPKKATISALYNASRLGRVDLFGDESNKCGGGSNVLVDPLDQHPFGMGSCHSQLETSHDIDIYRSRINDSDSNLQTTQGTMFDTSNKSGLMMTQEEEDFISQSTNPLLRMRAHAKKVRSQQMEEEGKGLLLTDAQSCHAVLLHSSDENRINDLVGSSNMTREKKNHDDDDVSTQSRRGGASPDSSDYHTSGKKSAHDNGDAAAGRRRTRNSDHQYSVLPIDGEEPDTDFSPEFAGSVSNEDDDITSSSGYESFADDDSSFN